MTQIYKDLLRDVLEGLEVEYRSKTKTSSAISFCTNVILSFIVEELETVFDGLVRYKISEEGEDPDRTAKSGVKCSQELEDVLMYYSWAIFFNNYRGCGPVGGGCLVGDASVQDQGVAGLGNDFSKILRDFGNFQPWLPCIAANASQRTI